MKGNQLATLTEISGSPEVVISSSGRGLDRKYSVAWNIVESSLPQIGDPDSEFSDMVVASVRYTRDGEVAMVTVEYRPPDLRSTLTPDTSQRVRRTTANAIEIPIEQHPDYSGSWGLDGTSYLDPQPQVTVTKHVTNFGWSEDEVVKNVGKRVAPPGISGATVAKWLKTGRECSDVGVSATGQKITEISDSYQYAENGWNTDVYPNTGND